MHGIHELDNTLLKLYNTSIRKELVPLGMISLKEYAERHGKAPVSVRQKAARGGFRTAQKIGRDWLIDENEPYDDRRVQSGNYVGWRDKLNKK